MPFHGKKKRKKKQGTSGTDPGRTLRSRKKLIEDSMLGDDDDLFDLLDKREKKLHKKN